METKIQYHQLTLDELNILDANVDAALIQFNVDENLSVRPVLYPNDVTLKTNIGLTLNYSF